MEAAGYSAFICAKMGANCIQLQKGGASLLRTPGDWEQFKRDPNLYGMPILFPPNRINHGEFQFNGTRYVFPINEISRGHHIHGFLSATPFLLCDTRTDANQASITFTYEATPELPYRCFPHTFKILLIYLLDEDGLHQSVEVTNTGDRPMPFFLGFHTAFNQRFLPHTEKEDYRLKIAVQNEIMLDRQTIIPTGEFIERNQLVQDLNDGNVCPGERVLSNHFVANKGGNKEAVYLHMPTGRKIRYTTCGCYNYWMVFNRGIDSGFICIEPQTCIVDAANSPLPPRITGFRALEKGEIVKLQTHLQEITET
jgi:aldose 1-epimerase